MVPQTVDEVIIGTGIVLRIVDEVTVTSVFPGTSEVAI